MQQLMAAVCLFLATGCGDCLQKTCRCNCPSNGAETVRLPLHVSKILHALLALTQNRKCKMLTLQGAADPATGTIAVQLDDTNGITINRAVV